MLILYIHYAAMKSIKVFLLPGLIIKKLGLTKIYYWFNR
jgi:hypothetical protein